jgi:phospholipid/cholesterol/gamma-HCH transport system substrate-binding protein
MLRLPHLLRLSALLLGVAPLPLAAQRGRVQVNELTIADLQSALRAKRTTCRAIVDAYLQRIDALTIAAKPGLDTLSTETLPEANRLVRDLRELTGSLGAVAAKLDEDPAGALLGGRPLPDYVPKKPETAK